MSLDLFEIVDKAVAGNRLELDEVAALCCAEPFSKQAYYMQWGARELLARAHGGKAEILGRIGVDAGPCDGCCDFCSFSATNHSWTGQKEIPQQTVLEYARELDAAGVQMLCLMTSCSYDLQRFLGLVSDVRGAVSDDLPIMADIADFGPSGAEALASCGVNAVYNAPRLGEGKMTAFDLEQRFATMDAANDAGLKICSGIEPLIPGTDPREIADRVLRILEYDPMLLEVRPLVPVTGTKWEGCSAIDAVRLHIIESACRLACGDRVPYDSANISWLDVGSCPYSTQMIAPFQFGAEADRLRHELEDAGWDIDITPRQPGGKLEAEREAVRRHYSQTAASVVSGTSCCSQANVYKPEDLAGLPLDAILASRGCADPHAFAGLQPGQTVLDLGSGGGIDCLIAAREVGDAGHVIGLDMTDEMLELAQSNLETSGISNVEFIKGYLEDIPLEDSSVDVVISNCVINLCSDKRMVLREAARVLRDGGKFVVADIVMTRDVDEDTNAKMSSFLGCGSRVLDEAGYRNMLAEAGFEDVQFVTQAPYNAAVLQARAERKGSQDLLASMDIDQADGSFAGAMVIARRRTRTQSSDAGEAGSAE